MLLPVAGSVDLREVQSAVSLARHECPRALCRARELRRAVVNVLLSITFACGVVIAVAHVLNTRFVAPAYDVVLNLLSFVCAVAVSVLLGHRVPGLLSALAVLCWLLLARRTILARRQSR